jgi:hypothetical protein
VGLLRLSDPSASCSARVSPGYLGRQRRSRCTPASRSTKDEGDSDDRHSDGGPSERGAGVQTEAFLAEFLPRMKMEPGVVEILHYADPRAALPSRWSCGRARPTCVATAKTS